MRRGDRISGVIVGSIFRVLNGLGAGFAKKVCENALAHEFGKAGLAVLHPRAIAVRYDEIVVDAYAADLLFGDSILGKPKAVRALDKAHMAPCIDYRTAAGLYVSLSFKSVGLASRPGE